jgi:Domain of unknown function (DUF3841)
MPSEPVQHLWTIQSADAWARAMERGILRGDGRRAARAFRPAYAWMRSQMARRLAAYSGEQPVWAWQLPRPDLRRRGHLPPGTRGVLVEFSAPSSQVLLSDFDGWHSVLNNDYLGLSESDDRVFRRRCTRTSGGVWADPCCRSRVEASWERIFELPPAGADPDGYGEPGFVQATLPYIRLDWVVATIGFVAR